MASPSGEWAGDASPPRLQSSPVVGNPSPRSLTPMKRLRSPACHDLHVFETSGDLIAPSTSALHRDWSELTRQFAGMEMGGRSPPEPRTSRLPIARSKETDPHGELLPLSLKPGGDPLPGSRQTTPPEAAEAAVEKEGPRMNCTTEFLPRLEEVLPERSSAPPMAAPFARDRRGTSAQKARLISRSPFPAPAAAVPQLPRRDGRIKVVVRKRPFNLGEVETGCVRVESPNLRVEFLKHRVDLTEYVECTDFTFDEVFDESVGNEQVYRSCAQELLDVGLRGGSASCFAYGQTGSGKTYTMMGGDGEKGLYLLAVIDLFERVTPSQVLHVSFYEIYCNCLFDLLNNRSPVVLRENARRRVKVCGLSWHPITSPAALWEIVHAGMELRSTGSTSANERSSRSHAVMTIRIEDTQVPDLCGMLNFVDLAGSERAADTANNDRQTRLEGAEINKSLLALKECIRALDEKKRHVPFRGSKLTEVLRDSFVGNSKTVMVANISPSAMNYEHTVNTLRYAFRVKGLSIPSVAPSKARNAPRLPAPSRTRSTTAAAGLRRGSPGRAEEAGARPGPRTPTKGRAGGRPAGERLERHGSVPPEAAPLLAASEAAAAAKTSLAAGEAVTAFVSAPPAHGPSAWPLAAVELQLKRRIMQQLQRDLGEEIRYILDERDALIAALRRENTELRATIAQLRTPPRSRGAPHKGLPSLEPSDLLDENDLNFQFYKV